jgi:Uncharacterized protein conserved in bacteria (DUF2188)
MPEGDVETYYRDGKWRNKVEGGLPSEPTAHLTKAVAVSVGREMAKQAKVEHIIRKKDGRIGQRNSYGHDPRNVPG